MKTLFRYRLTDNMKSLSILILVMVLIPIFMSGMGGRSAMNATTSVAGGIWALVIGAVAPRTDMRLGNQMGVGRPSAFLGSLLGNVVSFVVGAAGLTALTAALQLLTDGYQMIVMDVYQFFYSDSASYVMSGGDYAAMALMQLALYLCLGFSGMLCTTAFWRLGKLGKWILGIGMGLFFVVGVPNLAFWLAQYLLRPLRILASNVWALDAVLLACAAVFLLGTWLLARRAPILAPAKT